MKAHQVIPDKFNTPATYIPKIIVQIKGKNIMNNIIIINPIIPVAFNTSLNII